MHHFPALALIGEINKEKMLYASQDEINANVTAICSDSNNVLFDYPRGQANISGRFVSPPVFVYVCRSTCVFS